VPTSDYEEDWVEKIYEILEEIFVEDGKRETNTVAIGGWKSAFGDKSYRNTVVPHVLVRRSQRDKLL
jgi:hypothetical protein